MNINSDKAVLKDIFRYLKYLINTQSENLIVD